MRAARAQLRAELLAFLREPADLFFSVALPVLFLVLFTSIFGNEPVEGHPDIRTAQVPALVVTLLVGAVAITCLGVAATALVGSEGAASAITNAITLPLFFISGVFIPAESLPKALLTLGSLFPVRHLYDALVHVFDPGSGRAGFAPADLAVIAAWGVAGFLIASRTFRPFPRRDRE